MASEAEDFAPYKALKDTARKVSDFVGSKRETPQDTGTAGTAGTRRTPEEIKTARAESKSPATERQNVKAYNRSIRNEPGAIKQIEPFEGKKFEERKPIRKSPSRSSSRR